MKVMLKVGMLLAMVLALMPSITNAKPPDPKGKLVYQDDFSTSKSKLDDNLTGTDFSRGFHPPGVYHIKLSTPGEIRWSLFPNQSYANFTIEADMFDFSDALNAGDVSQGLVVRAQDNSHFYTVLIDPRKGEYSVRKQDGANNWTDLIAAKASSLVKRQKDVNHLRVDGDGGTFTIYLNDEQLDTFKDSSYSKGGVGFIVANVDATAPHMHFDNVKMYTTDAQSAGAPTTLPTTGEDQGTPALLWLVSALLLLSVGLGMRRWAR